MNSVAICSGSPQANTTGAVSGSLATFQIHGMSLGCALVETDMPAWDAADPAFSNQVLLKKLAFSCNFRDKSLLLNFASNIQKYTSESPDEFIYACIGSDFVARVMEIGSNVTHLKTGDLVIPNDCYPFVPDSDARPGIPTNEASSRMQILHKDKLIRIPENMKLEDAASFTIGAQTTYAMLRMAQADPHKKILVTSGRSNTSLFVISALKHKENLYVLTSSSADRERFLEMGVRNVISIDYNNKAFFTNPEELRAVMQTAGGFDVVIDPFIDIHLKHLVPVMRFGAVYISCGIYQQVLLNEDGMGKMDYLRIFSTLIQSNLVIRGNCLGNMEDLKNALDDYAAGSFRLPVDSVYSGNDIAGFFDKTYNAKDRWGKVVYRYEEEQE